jgi:hypothetical protein
MSYLLPYLSLKDIIVYQFIFFFAALTSLSKRKQLKAKLAFIFSKEEYILRNSKIICELSG